MELATIIPVIQTGGAICLGLIATGTDLKYRKIPNWLTFPAMLIGILVVIISEPHHWWIPLTGIGLGFLLLFLPFIAGGIGAGDVKLLMGLGAFLGPKQVFWVMMLSGIAGGLLSLLSLIKDEGFKNALLRCYLLFISLWSKRTRQMLQVEKYDSRKSIPYGVAIFIGLIMMLVLKPFIWGD